MNILINIPDNWKEFTDNEFIRMIAVALRDGVYLPDVIANEALDKKERFIKFLEDGLKAEDKEFIMAFVDNDVYDELCSYPDHRVTIL